MGILYKLFSEVFKKDIKKSNEEAFLSGKLDGRKEFHDEDRAERNKILNFELERMAKAGPVIALSNEWQNPVIGKVVNLTVSPWDKDKFVPMVKDYLTGNVFEEHRTLIPFSMKTLEAIGKLNPDDIVALFYEGRHSNKDVYKKRENITSSDETNYTDINDWLDRIDKKGFFLDYPEFKDTNLYREFSRGSDVVDETDVTETVAVEKSLDLLSSHRKMT